MISALEHSQKGSNGSFDSSIPAMLLQRNHQLMVMVSADDGQSE